MRDLAHSNLFVVSLDEQGEWYRYHHLFSELLFYELEGSRPDLVPILRRRASEWLEGEGYVDSAIRHAVEAEDFERVGLLIARHWLAYVLFGQKATVQRWLGSLPEGMIVHDAALCLVEAWIHAVNGRPEECEHFLSLAEGLAHEGPLPDGTASVEAGVATLRTINQGIRQARAANNGYPEAVPHSPKTAPDAQGAKRFTPRPLA